MFPFYENASEWDDFGEVINPDDYVIKDDDMDQGALPVSSLLQFSASMLPSLAALGTMGQNSFEYRVYLLMRSPVK